MPKDSAGHLIPGHRGPDNMARDEIAAVVDAAHQRGAKVRAHVCTKAKILECIELGVDIIDHGDEFADSPVEVREKVHRSRPMTLSDALREMELVGHDFYLFHDIDTDRASVVYRRHGWSYGVLHLDLDGSLGGNGEQGEGDDVEAAAS